MDGYLYMLIIFLLVFKCSIYFCWYKARRERYLQAQQQAAICTTIQNAQGNQVYVQNAQPNTMPPGAYQNQGLVERPVAPYYQHPEKPPAYKDIGGVENNTMNNQPPPPTYNYATTYPDNAGGPTNPGIAPYPYPGNMTYPYPAGVPANSGIATYPASTATTTNSGGPPMSPSSVPYPANTGGATTSPGSAPYPYPANTGGPMTSPGMIPYPATAPNQM